MGLVTIVFGAIGAFFAVIYKAPWGMGAISGVLLAIAGIWTRIHEERSKAPIKFGDPR